MKRAEMTLHDTDDADIAAWLEQQQNRAEAMRRACRLAMAAEHSPTPPALTPGLLRRIIREEIASLSPSSTASTPAIAETADADPAAAAALDAMF